MFKRTIGLLLVAILLVCLPPGSAMAAGADAPASWAEESVGAAIKLDLVPQPMQSNYLQAATRAEFAALAVALYEKVTGGEIAGRVTFADTQDVNVQKAAYIGVIKGVGHDRFNPDGVLNREQAATMLTRLAQAVGRPLHYILPPFEDMDSVSSWAERSVGHVYAAQADGHMSRIMIGLSDALFAPKSIYTREQSIVTILRLYTFLTSPLYQYDRFYECRDGEDGYDAVVSILQIPRALPVTAGAVMQVTGDHLQVNMELTLGPGEDYRVLQQAEMQDKIVLFTLFERFQTIEFVYRQYEYGLASITTREQAETAFGRPLAPYGEVEELFTGEFAEYLAALQYSLDVKSVISYDDEVLPSLPSNESIAELFEAAVKMLSRYQYSEPFYALNNDFGGEIHIDDSDGGEVIDGVPYLKTDVQYGRRSIRIRNC